MAIRTKRTNQRVIRNAYKAGELREYSPSYLPKYIRKELRKLEAEVPGSTAGFKEWAKESGLTKQQQAAYIQATKRAVKQNAEFREQYGLLTQKETDALIQKYRTDPETLARVLSSKTETDSIVPKRPRLVPPKPSQATIPFEELLRRQIDRGRDDYVSKTLAAYKRNLVKAVRESMLSPSKVVRALNKMTDAEYMEFLKMPESRIHFIYDDADAEETEELFLMAIEDAKEQAKARA